MKKLTKWRKDRKTKAIKQRMDELRKSHKTFTPEFNELAEQWWRLKFRPISGDISFTGNTKQDLIDREDLLIRAYKTLYPDKYERDMRNKQVLEDTHTDVVFDDYVEIEEPWNS